MGHPNTIWFKYFDFFPIIQTKTNLRQSLYQDTCIARSSGYTGEREESEKCCHVSLGSSRHFMRSCHLADDDALLGPYAWQHSAYEKYIWSSFHSDILESCQWKALFTHFEHRYLFLTVSTFIRNFIRNFPSTTWEIFPMLFLLSWKCFSHPVPHAGLTTRQH